MVLGKAQPKLGRMKIIASVYSKLFISYFEIFQMYRKVTKLYKELYNQFPWTVCVDLCGKILTFYHISLLYHSLY